VNERDEPNCTKFGEKRTPLFLHQSDSLVPIRYFLSK